MRLGVPLFTAIVSITAPIDRAAAEPPPPEVETIEVVGSAPLPGREQPLAHVPANVQRLDDLDVRRLAPFDVTSLLGRRATGVVLGQTQNNPYQPDLFYRGFASSFLLGTPQGLSVFQDGVRLNDFLGDALNWDLVPEDSLGVLEVVPGANPLYGRNTLGGAFALGTKSGRTHPGHSAEVSYGSFDRVDASLATGGTLGAKDEFDYFVTGDYGREDGFRDFSEGHVARVFARGGWRGADSEAWVTYNAARNELRGNGFAPESLLDEDRSAVFTHPDVFEPSLDFVTGHFAHAFGEEIRVDGAAFFRRLDIDQRNGDAADEEEEGGGDAAPLPGVENDTTIEQRRFGGSLQATGALEAGGEHLLVAGFDGEGGRGDVRFTERAGFLDETRAVVPTGEPELATDVETSGESFGLYASDTWTPREWLSVTASVRWDRTTIDIDNLLEPEAGGEHAFDRANPAAGVTLRPRDWLDVYGRYGESFRAPSAIELACADEDDPCPLPIAFADDPPLEEVKARSWETGLRVRPTKDVRGSLAFFTTELRDDILFVASERSEGFFRNVDETRRLGLEAAADGTVASVDWFLAYSFTRATFESTATLPSAAGENVARPGDVLPGIPNHLLKAGFDAPLPANLRFGLDLQFTGRRFLRGDESNDRGALDPYVVVNARLAYSWKWLTLFARAENLFDAEYESFGAFGENPLADGRVERFLSPGAPLGGWFGLRVDL